MKKSGYRSMLHIYLIVFLSLLGTILAACAMFLMLVTVRKPDGETVRSNWASLTVERVREQMVLVDGSPQPTQSGVEFLRDNRVGLQILDEAGKEVYSFQKSAYADEVYSNADLLKISETGHHGGGGSHTALAGEVTVQGREYVYLVHFPMEIKKVTMYLNGERFTGGKQVVFLTVGILFLVVLAAGVIYGFWMVKLMNRLTVSIHDISRRRYLPLEQKGAFGDLYGSLNELDREIKASDQLRDQTETMRKEWIANITHDLKTPLSPIKGYAELLQSDKAQTEEERERYAGIMLKNALHMEALIEDLKLTYQLESGMIPVNRQNRNLVRFLRELVIELLNRPDFENRRIEFVSSEETISYAFDEKLFTRAFQNLLINAFVHGEEETEAVVEIGRSENEVWIKISDNGRGMTAEEAKRLFERYYRGTDTGKKAEGSGLGLAIVKSIVELHGGTISVSSIPELGTAFQIKFKVI